MPPKYEIGERILARNANDKYFFDAKVVAIDDNTGEHCVHYQGWHKRYDEYIKKDDLADRTQKFTEEAHAKAKEIYASAKEANRKRRPRRTGDGINDKSRDTTPHSQANDEDSTIPSETSTKNARTRPSKRKIDEVIDNGKDAGHTAEYTLSLPLPLKEVLVEDYDLITRQMKIYSLPAKTTVAQIFDHYRTEMGIEATDNDEVLVEYDKSTKWKYSATDVIQSSKGILDYFEALLPMQLLYKYERPQYVANIENKKASNEPSSKKKRAAKEAVHEVTKPKASEIYGLPHLLRLLTRFEGYLKQSKYEERIKQSIQDIVCDFLVWLNKSHGKYFNPAEDYEVPAPDYQREAYT